MFLFKSCKEKMLMLGDFDLNSMQPCTDSLKDSFKQTMLEQEILFRNQVHELHRLYGVQKILMEDLEKYNSWKANVQPLPQETRFLLNPTPMVGLAVSSGWYLLEGWKGGCQKFEKRPFDLQLLPDYCISLSDNNLRGKVKVGDNLKETMDVNSLPGGDFSDPLDLRLGAAKRKKEDKQRSWYDKKTNTCSVSVVDLEESTKATNEDAKHPTFDFAAKFVYPEGKQDSQVTITSDLITSRSTEKDVSYEILESSPFVGSSRCCQDWRDSEQGLEHHENMPLENFLTRKRQLISCGVGHLDLNEVQLDDSSFHSNDAKALPSSTSSLGGFNGLVCRSQETLCPTKFSREEIKDFSKDTVEMLRKDNGVQLPLMNFNKKDRRTGIEIRNSEQSGRNECKTSLNSPVSVSRPQIDLSKDLGSVSGQTKTGRDELMLKLPNAPTHGETLSCAVSALVDCERIEERDIILLCSDEIQITVEDKHSDEGPVSGKSSCISDNAPSPLRVMQSEIGPYNFNLNIPASDQSSGTHGISQIAETLSGEQDQRSSDSNEIKHDECYSNGEESTEVDDLVQIAAESLIRISLENSPCHQEYSTQTGSNELENEEKEQQEHPSDSFELMTLKLKDSSADDYSVSSKPFEVGDSERKEFSLKLRRGRRMKDFQKDILPSLASLSRHEILEDINILEGVLRSREYKKMRAKMTNRESWSAPVRSRRSRRNYVGRKNFR